MDLTRPFSKRSMVLQLDCRCPWLSDGTYPSRPAISI